MPSAALASPYTIPFTYENSIANITPEFPITPTPLRPTPLHLNLTRKRSDDDTEIDVFAAEKYFNPDTNSPVDKTTKPSPSSSTPSNSHSLTSTLPESSSRHSSQTPLTTRNTLLRHTPRRTPAGCGAGTLLFLGGFGFWCSSCSRKHAPNVNRAKDSGSINANFVPQKQSICRSPASWRIETPVPAMWLSPQRRWPKLPPPKTFVEKEEDDRSESSSDLFEIESVTMSRAGGYEPSEASIAWSVVTASAANVSVASERSWEIGKGRRKSNALLLAAGCSSHKAVEVSTTSAAAVEVAESSISPVVARYHVDLEAGGGSGRIVAGRAKGTSWHGGSGRILL